MKMALTRWQWLETWLEQKQNEVDRITYQGYESYYRNHIGPYFKQHNVTFMIQSTVVRFSEIVEKDTTKSQASHRTYPMTSEIKEMLLSIRERQQEMKALIGNCYVDSGYVFTWEDGRILNPDYVTRKRYLYTEGKKIPVSEEIYHVYYQFARKER